MITLSAIISMPGKRPNQPEKDQPAKPDVNPDPTLPKPGGNEPEKNDPTRIVPAPEPAEPVQPPAPASPPPSTK